MKSTILLVSLALASALVGQSTSSCWQRRSTATAPSARETYGMVHVAKAGYTLLFGGNDDTGKLADTWTWDGSVWNRLSPTTIPSARTLQGMAYDSARNRVVMFGGVSASGNLADTWEWDGSNWVDMNPKTSPPAVFGHSLAYDAKRQRTVFFGGWTGALRLAETWEWDGNNWVKRNPTSAPQPRSRLAMAYDPLRGTTVLFSGEAPFTYADTWEWDGNNWTKRSLTPSPPGQTGHSMIYDAVRKTVVMLQIQAGIATWEFDGSKWTQIPCGASPQPYFSGPIAYDPARKSAVTLITMKANSAPETWELSDPAAYATFGAGCAGSAPPPRLSAPSAPRVGSTFTIQIANLKPLSGGLLIFGASSRSWNSAPLPLDLALLGMGGCKMLVSPDVGTSVFSQPGGTLDWRVNIPPSATLIGATFFNQAWVLDQLANNLGIATSNGGEGVVGF